MSDSIPLLSLRMKNTSPGFRVEMDREELLDILAAMTAREQTYKCGDYLSSSQNTEPNNPPHLVDDDAIERNLVAGCVIDATCREKMCEWSYRVCDHFRCPREIVAYAISFLDRFVNSCACDRTAFKLASMTTLYMATKIFNGKQISIGTLAELSRGEFEIAHIAEMERIILETLEWRLNPPTVQGYIGLFAQLMPSDDKYMREIYQRAIFFSELCVYDYVSSILHDRTIVAVAAVLNAVEGIDDQVLAQELKSLFLQDLLEDKGIPLSINLDQVERAQGRLWYLYSCSAQRQEGDLLPVCAQGTRLAKQASTKGRFDLGHHSPVSVAQKGRY